MVTPIRGDKDKPPADITLHKLLADRSFGLYIKDQTDELRSHEHKHTHTIVHSHMTQILERSSEMHIHPTSALIHTIIYCATVMCENHSEKVADTLLDEILHNTRAELHHGKRNKDKK